MSSPGTSGGLMVARRRPRRCSKQTDPLQILLDSSTLCDSDPYETDLEQEKDEEPFDTSDIGIGADTYRQECARMKLIPQTAIMTQLTSDSTLTVRNRSLGTKGVEALVTALKKNTRIQHLDLQGNKIEAEGTLAVAELLMTNDFITSVNLSKNNLGTLRCIVQASAVIADVMKMSTCITHLNLSGNEFSDEDAKFLASGIEGTDKIVDLNLSHNNIQERGAQYIGRAIGENRSIEKLDLSWNHIRKRGAVTLCRALSRNKTLTSLDLSWNGFGYEGCLALSQTLKRNRFLKELNLSNNRITWNAVEFVSNGLRGNSTLEVLKIGLNPLTTGGCMELLHGASHEESAIKHLDISGNLHKDSYLACGLIGILVRIALLMKYEHQINTQGAPVLSEFELLAKAVQSTRDFHYVHGGVVSHHDVFGEKKDEDNTKAMRKVINYMNAKNLRPTELFKSIDKESMYELTNEAFMNRMKQSDIGLHRKDVEDVVKMMNETGKGNKEGSVNITKLAHGVKTQIRNDKLAEIKRKEEEKKRQEYHKRILNPEEPNLKEIRHPTSARSRENGSKPVTPIPVPEGSVVYSAGRSRVLSATRRTPTPVLVHRKSEDHIKTPVQNIPLGSSTQQRTGSTSPRQKHVRRRRVVSQEQAIRVASRNHSASREGRNEDGSRLSGREGTHLITEKSRASLTPSATVSVISMDIPGLPSSESSFMDKTRSRKKTV